VNGKLKGILVPSREEVMKGRRSLHNEELHDLNTSLGTCSTHGEDEKLVKLIIDKPGRPRHILVYKENIRVYLKEENMRVWRGFN
jgi:hypothetical protein